MKMGSKIICTQQGNDLVQRRMKRFCTLAELLTDADI